MITNPLYTIQRCRNDDRLYGQIHGAENDSQTLCGQKIDQKWWIITNSRDGEITCKKCCEEQPAQETCCSDYRKADGILLGDIQKLLDENAELGAERGRLRELVNAVVCDAEEGGMWCSMYCKDINGVNWFDARDALAGKEGE